MSKVKMQCSRKAFTMFVNEVFDVGIARVILEYLSIMAASYWFPCAISGSGQRIFIATKSSGSAVGKS